MLNVVPHVIHGMLGGVQISCHCDVIIVGCNIFVYCPTVTGCDNGYGIIVPSNVCTLKAAQLTSGKSVVAYSRGNTTFTSGWTSEKLLPQMHSIAQACEKLGKKLSIARL